MIASNGSNVKNNKITFSDSELKELRTPGEFISDFIITFFQSLIRSFEQERARSPCKGWIDLSVLEYARQFDSSFYRSLSFPSSSSSSSSTVVSSSSSSSLSSSSSSSLTIPEQKTQGLEIVQVHCDKGHYALSYKLHGEKKVHLVDSKLSESGLAIPRKTGKGLTGRKRFKWDYSPFLQSRKGILQEIQLLYGEGCSIIVDPVKKQSEHGNSCALHVILYILSLYLHPSVSITSLSMADDQTLRNEFVKAYLRYQRGMSTTLIFERLLSHCIVENVITKRSKQWTLKQCKDASRDWMGFLSKRIF